MGRDKALLPLGGRSLLDIALDKLRALPLPLHRESRVGVRMPEPLQICTRMRTAERDRSGAHGEPPAAQRVSAARYAAFAGEVPDLDAPPCTNYPSMVTVPRINGRPQPLCAVYRRKLLGSITASLLAGNYKVMQVVCSAAPRTRVIDVFDVELVASADPEIFAFSPLPAYRWFHNCNTPEDMAGIENALVLTQ